MACLRTYAGLCIYSPDLSPDSITSALMIQPTRTVDRDPESRRPGQRKHNFWLWTTDGLVESTDHLDHMRRIFEVLEGKSEALDKIRTKGSTTTISIYWDSNGQGGPSLDIATIAELHRYGLDIWWDIYFVSDDDADNGA